ncbi:hypothetical protein BH11BAC3_BH11BAC3_29620 [soil metagenome]
MPTNKKSFCAIFYKRLGNDRIWVFYSMQSELQKFTLVVNFYHMQLYLVYIAIAVFLCDNTNVGHNVITD